MFILPLNASFGQVTKTLEGVWYAKHLTYQFPQDGSANIFSKKTIPDFTKKLDIDSLGNYMFLLKSTGNIDTLFGKVFISKNTINFNGKLKDGRTFNESYIIYTLSNDKLIYSNKRISTLPTGEADNGLFMPVETPSRFKFGQDSLLSLIYREIVSNDSDSVRLNAYKFVVDAAGIAIPATVTRVKGNQDYLLQLKGIVEKYYREFIPATQNGRPVSSELTITFTL